jgi:hypothetical protein
MILLTRIALSVTLIIIALMAAALAGLLNPLFAMNEPAIRQIIDDTYPDSDPDVEFTENCTICDEQGCRIHPGPCWKIQIITEEDDGSSLVSIIMDTGGGTRDTTTVPCTEWWCEATRCRFSYSEQSEGVTMGYNNFDCEGEHTICDATHQRCRSCLEGLDCLASITQSGPSGTTYRTEVLGTGEYSEISSSELVCRIFSRGNKIFEGPTTIGECQDMVSRNLFCNEGSCDFAPDFEILPF